YFTVDSNPGAELSSGAAETRCCMGQETGRNPGRRASPSAEARSGPASSATLADTHVHLQAPAFAADLDAVLERARAAGVQRVLCAEFDLPSSREAVNLAERHPDVLAAVGVHPHDAKTYDDALE